MTSQPSLGCLGAHRSLATPPPHRSLADQHDGCRCCLCLGARARVALRFVCMACVPRGPDGVSPRATAARDLLLLSCELAPPCLSLQQLLLHGAVMACARW
jgi:hypothetical protein